MTDRRVPYSEDEAQEAWLWVGRHGPGQLMDGHERHSGQNDWPTP